MILQALKEYYDRKAKLDIKNKVAEGLQYKEIPYIIVLDKLGNIVNIEPTEEPNKGVKKFLVSRDVGKSTKIIVNLLWETFEYVIGNNISGNPDRVSKMHKAFVDKVNSLGDLFDDGYKAVKIFLSKQNKIKLLEDKAKENINFGHCLNLLLEKNSNVTFRLQGEDLIVSESETVKEAIQKMYYLQGGSKNICLISGEKDIVLETHPKILGNAKLVSFQKSSGYDSYGKQQGYNAPCGRKAISSYSDALRSLLSKDSTQKLRYPIGNIFMVFWSDKTNKLDNFHAFFDVPPKDNPDAGTDAVKDLINSINSGALNINDGSKIKFYVLGVSEAKGRLIVRFFIKDNVWNMACNIRSYFEELKIVHSNFENDFLPLIKLLSSTAVQDDIKNISPHLTESFMLSALNKDLPYPKTLLQAIINRIKAEVDKKDSKTKKRVQNITYARAALIKAYINRLNKKEVIKVALDKDNENIGYVLGRLFAVFEKAQEAALGKTNTTIMRYYGAASSTPANVFANLVKLNKHHLNKIRKEKPGYYTIFQKLIEEIENKIKINDDITYPSTLSLLNQGNFSVGYYHQRYDLFPKNKTSN